MLLSEVIPFIFLDWCLVLGDGPRSFSRVKILAELSKETTPDSSSGGRLAAVLLLYLILTFSHVMSSTLNINVNIINEMRAY